MTDYNFLLLWKIWLGPGAVRRELLRGPPHLLRGRYCRTFPLPGDVSEINLDQILYLRKVPGLVFT